MVATEIRLSVVLAAETVAVLVRKAGLVTVGAVAVIVTVALALAATVPSRAVTAPPDCEQPPLDAVHEEKVSPAGKRSVTMTFKALALPVLFTVME